MTTWHPVAHLDLVRLRTDLYQTVRQFFAERQVLEVETPILSTASVPEPLIEPFYTEYYGQEKKRLFLQTSPELHMKRLLATGYGAIYQIAKVFRNGESGRWHNPEFTLLEWYHPDFSTTELIQEISELLSCLLSCSPIETISYCELFEKYTYFHPLDIALHDLQQYVAHQGLQHAHALNRDTCLQFIMAYHIEPQLGHNAPLAVTDFPASQAALARRRIDNPTLAERFEIYMNGIELANGFHELTDSVEQRQRFEQDLTTRQANGQAAHPLDEHFLAALEAGLPDCSGVAMGIDRLLMLMAHATHIDQVLTFPLSNA